MSDILDDVDVVVPPSYSCEEFEVAASTILECQDFVASGCPGVAPCDELETLYFASLADHRSLVALRTAWLQSAAEAESAESAESPDSEDAEAPTPSIH